jgi:aerobic-type carbon monoxide dehydrogenase small subunit (CoxS/CutS family)
MMSYKITINGEVHEVDVESDTPLLWVIRDHLGMTGTKFGCGIMQCGACTVHIDGQATRSCMLPIESLEGREVTTIEGLSANGEHPLQQAWVENNVPQCGYCQAGMLMAASSLLEQSPDPSDEEIESAVSNICRCGTYARVKATIKQVAGATAGATAGQEG